MILSVWPVELTLAYWDRVKKSDRLWFDQGFRHLLTEFEASAEKLKGLKKSTENLKRIDDFKEFKEEFRRILQPCHHNLRLVIDKIDHAKRIDDNDKKAYPFRSGAHKVLPTLAHAALCPERHTGLPIASSGAKLNRA